MTTTARKKTTTTTTPNRDARRRAGRLRVEVFLGALTPAQALRGEPPEVREPLIELLKMDGVEVGALVEEDADLPRP